jgi:curli biogenesis system outer membrane secretion channel CsgG
MRFRFRMVARIKLPLVFAILSVMAVFSMSARAQGGLDATSTTLIETESRPVLKRKVGIARFSNETQSGNSFLVDSSGDRIGKQAADILSARLAETGMFLMFERLDAGDIATEKMVSGLKERGVSIDYLIVGSVSEFGRSTESESGIFQRKKIQRAYSKVNVRLIDVSTGRIIFSAEGAGEATSTAKKTFGAGSSAGYDQSLTDKSMSAAISQLISNLVENMTRNPWKSFLLAYEEPLYIISGGSSQGLVPGTKLSVFEVGREVKNPQTGAIIQLPGKNIGVIEVVYSVGEDEFSEVSFAELAPGTVISKPLSSYFIQEK